MAKSYCLTVEVTSDHVKGGLGYMIAFCIPSHISTPADMPEFSVWKEDVKSIVLQTGDQCLHSDPYTKKLAIAGMMHDLAELNKKYDIQIGFLPHVPAVQIHSANIFDNTLEVEFTDHAGHYVVIEKGIEDLQRATITEHGKTGLTDAARRHFPFKKEADGAARLPRIDKNRISAFPPHP